jgi:hypothetical protein
MCVSLGSTKATNRKSFRHHLVTTHRVDLIRTRRGNRWFDVLRQLSGAELQRRAAAVDKRSMSASRRRELGISTPRPSDGRRRVAAAGFAHCPKSSSGNDRPVTSSVSIAPQECEQPPDYHQDSDTNTSWAQVSAEGWSPSDEYDWCEVDFEASEPEKVAMVPTVTAHEPWLSQLMFSRNRPPCAAWRRYRVSTLPDDLPELEEGAAETPSVCTYPEDLPLLELLPTYMSGSGVQSKASSPVPQFPPRSPSPASPLLSSVGVADLLLPPPSPFADPEDVEDNWDLSASVAKPM